MPLTSHLIFEMEPTSSKKDNHRNRVNLAMDLRANMKLVTVPACGYYGCCVVFPRGAVPAVVRDCFQDGTAGRWWHLHDIVDGLILGPNKLVCFGCVFIPGISAG